MIEFTVQEKKYNGDLIDHGTHSFRLAPRFREHIRLDDAHGEAQIYQVIAVIHPTNPTATETAGDLIVRYVADDVEFRNSL